MRRIGFQQLGIQTKSGSCDPASRQLDEENAGDGEEAEDEVGIEEKGEHDRDLLHITNASLRRFHV